jgi:tetratricopeptide (TPR) repeat protein
MARGQAAVEMAKSPDEYDSAIKEFQQASRLAPDWPDPYYNLAILQEKTGKLKEAVASLKEYLRLAPNAPDAAKIQEHIYKLEYKAEQVLSVHEIIDVLVSGFQYSEEWEDSLLVKTGIRKCGGHHSEVSFQREGVDTVRALLANNYGRQYFQTLKVTGPVLRYITTVNVCSLDANEQLGGCDIVQEYEVEIVSKRLIKVNRKVIGTVTMKGASTQKGDIVSCTFQKK